jgi:hypothetical protein
MKDTNKLVEQALNEMAKIGIIGGLTIIVNSNDHGQPHFHYGKYKILIPQKMPKTIDELKKYVDKSQINQINGAELQDLLSFLKERNSKNRKLTNLEVISLFWTIFKGQ